MKPKAWDNSKILKLIGQVVNISVGQKDFNNVYLENLKLPRNDEGRVLVHFITEAGQGELGFIRSRAVSIIGTGAEPVIDKRIDQLQRMQGYKEEEEL